MSYYRYAHQRDTYSHPNHYHYHYNGHAYGPAGLPRGQPLRAYEEPRNHGYMSYSNRSGLGGTGNPFSKSYSHYNTIPQIPRLLLCINGKH